MQHHLRSTSCRNAFLLVLATTATVGRAQFALGICSGLLAGADAGTLAPRTAFGADLLHLTHFTGLRAGPVQAGLAVFAGAQFETICFRDDLVFHSDAAGTTVAMDDTTGRQYTRGLFGTGSSLSSTHISAPIMLYIPMGKRNAWRASIGLRPRYLIGGRFRRAYRVDGEKTVVRTRLAADEDRFHLNTFDVQVCASIAYRNIELSGHWSLVPLFRRGFGPDVRYAQVVLKCYIGRMPW